MGVNRLTVDREQYASDCAIRHPVFTFRDSPRGSSKICACWAQFAFLAASSQREPSREGQAWFQDILCPQCLTSREIPWSKTWLKPCRGRPFGSTSRFGIEEGNGNADEPHKRWALE